MVCLQKIVTSTKVSSTVYHTKLFLDEKAQPDPYIRHTILQAAPLTFKKNKGF